MFRQRTRRAAPVSQRSELGADHSHVHQHRMPYEREVFLMPAVALEPGLEARGDGPCIFGLRQGREEERELVTAKPGVQFPQVSRTVPAQILSQQILGAQVLGEDAGHAGDDAVPDGMAERVVDPLEARQVDDAEGAPADPLFHREERLDAFHEPLEVEQPCLGVTVGLLGKLGHDLFEVAGDVRDGGLAPDDLIAQPAQLVRERGGQRLDGFGPRFLRQASFAVQHVAHGREQSRLLIDGRLEIVIDPMPEIVGRRRS